MRRIVTTHKHRLFLLAYVILLTASMNVIASDKLRNDAIKNRLDIVGAKVHGQPSVGIDDLAGLEPVCELILRHQRKQEENRSLGIWYVQLEGSPLLDLPQYNIAKGAVSFHHYCWGEVVRGRAFRETNAKKRRDLAEYAMSGSKYVIDHPEFHPRNWPYLSHVYVTMGTGYMLMKEHGAAINAFLMALQLNPRERNAYTNIADAYVETGKKSEALTYATEGLKYFPNNKALTRRYNELGGTLPYPAPYPDLKNTGNEVGVSEKEAGNEIKKDVKAEMKEEISLPAQPNQPNPNNKKNPYCRFCAD